MPLSDLKLLLAGLEPTLNPGVFVFAVMPLGTDTGPLAPIATVREVEGLTVVVPEATARRHGLAPLFRAAWLTLRVPSDLTAVGLTAAFARVLAEVGISCNVIAGAHHDHLFVPVERAADALAALQGLQQRQG